MTGEGLKLKLVTKSQRNTASKQHPLEKCFPGLFYWLFNVIENTSASSSDWNGKIYAKERKDQTEGNFNPEKVTIPI